MQSGDEHYHYFNLQGGQRARHTLTESKEMAFPPLHPLLKCTGETKGGQQEHGPPSPVLAHLCLPRTNKGSSTRSSGKAWPALVAAGLEDAVTLLCPLDVPLWPVRSQAQSPAGAAAPVPLTLSSSSESEVTPCLWQLDLALYTSTLRLLLHNDHEQDQHIMFVTIPLCKLERIRHFTGKKKKKKIKLNNFPESPACSLKTQLSPLLQKQFCAAHSAGREETF